MLPLKPPAFRKNNFIEQKKFLFYLVFGWFAIAFAGCNNGNSGNTTGNNDLNNVDTNNLKPPGVKPTAFDSLHVLYISNEALKNIIQKGQGKLVFEFLKTQNDTLTLLLWRAAKDIEGNTNFYIESTLKIGKEAKFIDPQNKNIIVGTIEINNKEQDLKKLKDIVRAKKYKYILLAPDLAPYGQNANTYMIKYKFWGADTTLVDSTSTLKSATKLGLSSPNPSPPKQSY